MPRIQAAAVVQQMSLQGRRELEATAGATATTPDRALISRAEQATLAPELRDAVEDVRVAGGPGTRVSLEAAVSAFERRLQGEVAQVNQPVGSGKAWLSKQELAALTTRNPAVGQRAQNAVDILTQPVLPPPAPLTGAQIAAALAPLTANLFFDGLLGSEGGEPITSVIATRPFAPPLDGGSFARAFGIDTSTDQGFIERDLRLGPTSTLLQDFIDSTSAPEAAQVVALLKQLGDLRAFVIGKDGAPNVDANHPLYIVGTSSDGALVGIKSGVIWT